MVTQATQFNHRLSFFTKRNLKRSIVFENKF